MAENGRFDPMVLESLLHYPETLGNTPLVVRREANVVEEGPCMEITEAGAMGSSALDLMQSPAHGDCTGTEVGEEHGPATLTQRVGNGGTITNQQQEEEHPVLNPPSEGSKKRKNWSKEETDLLLEVVDSEKTKPRSRLDYEPLWEGVAKRVPGRSEKKCRMRMETLRKSYNKVKEYCDKEKKQFGELKGADFEKMKLATRMTERWYNRIGDHFPPRPTKKSTKDVATRRGPRGVRESSAASVVVMEQSGYAMKILAGVMQRKRYNLIQTTLYKHYTINVSVSTPS